MRKRFDALLQRVVRAELRSVLHSYYGLGMTDDQVAISLCCSRSAVNRTRNRFIRQLKRKET